MLWIETFLVALSTYSALPMPQFRWNEKNMQYALCFFPAVGLICGGGLWLWNSVCARFAIDSVLFAAAAACLPLLLTGGIHMDGYMDTCDALASHQSRERKLEIMKDSHCGAFAVICCGVYLLLQFGLLHALFQAESVTVFCFAFPLSRSLSALCAVTLPSARKNGMLCAFTEHAQKTGAAVAMGSVALLSTGGMIWYAPVQGGVAAVVVLIWVLLYRRMTKKQFGGATGDTAGFFLQICELTTLAGVWLGGLL